MNQQSYSRLWGKVTIAHWIISQAAQGSPPVSPSRAVIGASTIQTGGWTSKSEIQSFCLSNNPSNCVGYNNCASYESTCP